MSTQNENLPTVQKTKKYVFAQRQQDDYTCIKLVEDKYKDIIYKYGKVKFGKKETAKGELPLTFHYDLIYSNDMSGKELQEDLKFKNLLGDILMAVSYTHLTLPTKRIV